jgi:molybdate/tungstate transport system permease protein
MNNRSARGSSLTAFGGEPLYLIFTALGGLVLLFIIAPLVGMFLHSSVSELKESAADIEVSRSIWLTLWTAMGATLISAIAAIPFSYILARKNFPLKGLVNGIIDIPIVIPHPAAGIALLSVIARDALAGKIAGRAGISFVSNPAGIIAAMAFVSIPFLVNAARDGFQAVPERLEKAALNLGASPTRVFFTISLPLAWRSILSGLILMWGRGMSEFGAVIIVAYNPMVAPILIYERFGAFGLKYARPAAALFVSVCLALFIVLRLIGGKRVAAQH